MACGYLIDYAYSAAVMRASPRTAGDFLAAGEVFGLYWRCWDVPAIKILHMADMHLEWPFAGMGMDRTRGRLRREELKKVFAGIIDLAEQEEVQVLLIAGDLLEHQHATRGTAQFLDRQFRRIPGTRIFISPGNHDPFLPNSYYQTYPWSENVHIFGPEPERVDLPDLPVSVLGWGFPAWEVGEWRLASVPALDPQRINLAVFHGGEGAYHPFRPADLAGLAAHGVDYIALGHIHQGGVLLEQGGRVVARYSGSPEALSFGEPGEHGVFLGTVSKEESRVAFRPTGLRRYISREVPVDGAVSLEDVVARILAVDDSAARQQHCYRLTLTGTVDPGLAVDLALLREMVQGEFYHVKLLDETRPDWDLDALAEERSARGLFVQQMRAMAQAEADPAVRRRVLRALDLGLQALAGKEGGR